MCFFSTIGRILNLKGFKNIVWRSTLKKKKKKRNEKKHQLCIQKQRVFPDSHPGWDHPVTRGWVTVGGLRSGTCQRSGVWRAHNAVMKRRGRPRHAWNNLLPLLDLGFFSLLFCITRTYSASLRFKHNTKCKSLKQPSSRHSPFFCTIIFSWKLNLWCKDNTNIQHHLLFAFIWLNELRSTLKRSRYI